MNLYCTEQNAAYTLCFTPTVSPNAPVSRSYSSRARSTKPTKIGGGGKSGGIKPISQHEGTNVRTSILRSGPILFQGYFCAEKSHVPSKYKWERREDDESNQRTGSEKYSKFEPPVLRRNTETPVYCTHRLHTLR